MVVQRFDVFLVALNPTVGNEIRKTRPCLVVSPDQINRHLQTVLVAPLTTRSRSYPFRAPCRFQGKAGQVALDQMRAVDRSRLVKRLGRFGGQSQIRVLKILQQMFAP